MKTLILNTFLVIALCGFAWAEPTPQCPASDAVVESDIHALHQKQAKENKCYAVYYYVGDFVSFDCDKPANMPTVCEVSNVVDMPTMSGMIKVNSPVPFVVSIGSFINTIQEVVDPDSWKDSNTGIAPHFAIKSIVIEQTKEVHAQIECLLDQLREKINVGIPLQQVSSLASGEEKNNRPRTLRERVRGRILSANNSRTLMR